MKLRTMLALVLIGLLAACGCRDKARDAAPEQQGGEEKPRDKDPRKNEDDKDKKKDKDRKKKDKDRKEEKGKTPNAPEPIEIQPNTEPADEQEARPEELPAPNVEKDEGGRDEPKAELLPPPEVEKGDR
jgi:hypothetical protein